jgi:hypothetical protein
LQVQQAAASAFQQQHNKALHPTAYSPAFRSQARFTSGFRRRVSLSLCGGARLNSKSN